MDLHTKGNQTDLQSIESQGAIASRFATQRLLDGITCAICTPGLRPPLLFGISGRGHPPAPYEPRPAHFPAPASIGSASTPDALRATRKPRKLLRYDGSNQWRIADLQYLASLYKLPPRTTR